MALSAGGARASSADSFHRVGVDEGVLSLRADFLEDPGGELVLEDVRRRDAEFLPLQGTALPGGKSAWWLRFSLSRDPAVDPERVLIVGAPSLLSARLYVPLAGSYREYRGGAEVAQSKRVLPAWEPRFPVVLEEQVQTLYLRVYDPAELVVPLRLVDALALAQRDSTQTVWMSLFLGLMVGLLVYNLLLYLILLDPAYGWYVASGTSLLLCFLMITGWGGRYLWPESGSFEVLARLFLPAVWGVAYWRFIARFFALRDTYPRLNRLVNVFSGLFVLLALWSLGGERYYGAMAMHLLAIVALPFVFVIGIYRWRDGFRPAGVLMAGQFALILPVFLLALRVAGVIGTSELLDYGLLLGAAAETLLFAVALAQRIRSAEHGRDNALGLLLAERQARLEQVEAHNEELEQRVDQRTAQLQEANRNLERQKLSLAREAGQDNLTGLSNRRSLARRFELVNDLSRRSGQQSALLLLDLDGFKRVNDSAGHDAGDAVLKTLAERLQSLVRAGDTLARIGGDEFVVLMAQNASEGEARVFAQRLLAAVGQPVHFEEQVHLLGASLGIAISVPGTESLSQLMRRADQAMYDAKRGDHEPRIRVAPQR